MTDVYETARTINQGLAAAAFLWLTWRTVRAWPAEWAKPNHVVHYRALLVLGSGLLLTATLGAFHYSTTNAPPSPVAVLVTAVCILALTICATWPKPAAWRARP